LPRSEFRENEEKGKKKTPRKYPQRGARDANSLAGTTENAALHKSPSRQEKKRGGKRGRTFSRMAFFGEKKNRLL